MSSSEESSEQRRPGAFEPLRQPVFRGIWFASLFSNFGQLILGVGAAWDMTRMSSSPSMVALVQTALMLPLMLVALPAGAIADMYDRRKVALLGIGLAMFWAGGLTLIAFLGLITPWTLLTFCFLIGAGVALYNPAWMASISEQVPTRLIPPAVALGAISYNVARSFGPALGGLIVLALGAQAAFAINTFFYIPLFAMYVLWKRQHLPSRLPPERIDRAIMAGVRYARHSTPVRAVIGRSLIFGFTTSTVYALTPLVAKDLLGGNAGTYGILLGVLGVGSICGAVMTNSFRARFSPEANLRIGTIVTAAALVAVGFSTRLWSTCAALFIVGFCNMVIFAMLNTAVQLSVPRWVTARSLSLYSSALTGGMAIGAWVWGELATASDVATTFVTSGAATAAGLFAGFFIPLPRKEEEAEINLVDLGKVGPVEMNLTLRSGPVVIEVDYDVDPARARDFHEVVTQLGKARKGIGAFDWSLARDISNPALWTERYHCPTWGDYLRMRNRYSEAIRALQEQANAFDRFDGRRVRRRLERPYGSVRWKAESPDPRVDPVGYI